MKLHFYGAAREVTGTCYMLETGSHKILIDCGIFQGSREDAPRNLLPFPFDPSELDAVILTHAHMDHIGRVPQLIRRGYRGPIFCTAPTADLAQLMWIDMVHLQEEAEKKIGLEPMYGIPEVDRTGRQLQAVEYKMPFELCAGALKVSLHDDGHVLGSAFVRIEVEDRIVVFSGDVGNIDAPVIAETSALGPVDVLVVESTYGDRVHEDVAERVTILRDLVKETVENKGVLIIPTFAIERTQEIVLTLHQLAEKKEIPHVPIFLDSPLAIAATHVYEEYPQYFNAEARKEFLDGHQLFTLPGFKMTKSVDDSKAINNVPAPKVILAGAGMMTGGRIRHHLAKYLPEPTTTVLIVGYQARGTLGRLLYEGVKNVTLHGKNVHVNAKVTAVGGWSAHADQKKLMEWVGAVTPKPEVVFVTHGEEHAAEALARKLNRDLGIQAEVPNPGQTFDLHVKGHRV